MHASLEHQHVGFDALTRSNSDDLVPVQFWMNGCSQVAHVSRDGLRRCQQELLATGAVLLN